MPTDTTDISINEQDSTAFFDWVETQPHYDDVQKDTWKAACAYKDKQHAEFRKAATTVADYNIEQLHVFSELKEQLAAKDAKNNEVFLKNQKMLTKLVEKQNECEQLLYRIAAKDAVIAKKDEALLWVSSRWADVSTLALVREALATPNDDSALQEYVENRVSASPEIALLNQIEDLLEPVDYQGSYVDGIRALVSQTKREAIDKYQSRFVPEARK